MEKHEYQAVVVGGSSGGFNALLKLLELLPDTFPVPIMVVLHRSPDTDSRMTALLNQAKRPVVKEADDKEVPMPGTVYLAPANYHLLVERDLTLSLSIDERVWYSRPSIDVLFETAADAYGDGMIGVLMTGANQDGTQGLRRIRQRGGLALVQDPQEAAIPFMPAAAIRAGEVDQVLPLAKIGSLLVELTKFKPSIHKMDVEDG